MNTVTEYFKWNRKNIDRHIECCKTTFKQISSNKTIDSFFKRTPKRNIAEVYQIGSQESLINESLDYNNNQTIIQIEPEISSDNNDNLEQFANKRQCVDLISQVKFCSGIQVDDVYQKLPYT